MSDISHRVHGVGSEDAAPDWPPLQTSELDVLLFITLWEVVRIGSVDLIVRKA